MCIKRDVCISLLTLFHHTNTNQQYITETTQKLFPVPFMPPLPSHISVGGQVELTTGTTDGL